MSTPNWTLERQTDLSMATSEQFDRMDTDLVILDQLGHELPPRLGARVITDKGYAVDALCCGTYRRAHYDADILLATPDINNPEEQAEIISQVLADTTGFAWDIAPQDRKSWLKFYQAGSRRWSEHAETPGDDSTLAQQLDVHMVHAPDPFKSADYINLQSTQKRRYGMHVQQAMLRDSRGGHHTLTVPIVNELVVTKLRLVHGMAGENPDGQRASDLQDFAALFDHSQYDAEACRTGLEAYYQALGYKSQQRAEVTRFIFKRLATIGEIDAL